MSVKEIVYRELQFMFKKEPVLIFLMVGVAAAYTAFMGMLYQPNIVNDIPLVIYDQDQTKVSRTLIQAFDDDERYKIVAYVQSQEEMEALMKEKISYCSVAIPPDFSRDTKNGRGSQILFGLNGANIVFAGSILSPTMEVIGDFSARLGAGLAEVSGQLPGQSLKNVAPIQLRLRALNNPTLNYSSFFVMGILFTAFQSGVMMAVSISVAGDLQKKCAEIQAVAPVRFLFAKLLPYWIGGLIGFAIAIGIAVGPFGIPFRGSIVRLLLLGGLFIFVIIAQAALLAVLCRNPLTPVQVIVAYAVPCFLFSGYTWPQQSMNLFSRIISFSLPLTYIADNLRDLALNGYAPDLAFSTWVLGIMGSVFFVLAIKIYPPMQRKAMQQNGAGGVA